jgi:Tol biopolymer transport system component
MMRFALLLLSTVFPLATLVSVAAAQELRPVYTELGSLGEGAIATIADSPGGRFVLYGAAQSGGTLVGEARIFDRGSANWFGIGRQESDYAWSPRGDRIAFAKVDEHGRNMYVWTMPMDPRTGRPTGLPRRIAVRPGRGPAFSPDGRTVAFTVIPPSDTAAPRIVAVPAVGGSETVLARQPGWAQQLRWSPDGRWVYYRIRIEPGPGGLGLARVSAHGGEPQVVRRVQDFLGISSDGRFLAFVPLDVAPGTNRMVIGVATADGIEVGRFALPRDMVARNWSASGLKLLAQRNHAAIAIHTISLHGGAPRSLAAASGSTAAPAWSPDGRRVVYSTLIDDRLQLMLVDARGGARRQVPTRAEPDWAPPLWSPDGRFIAFFSTSPGERSLHVVEISTGAETRLATAASLDAVTWRRDGRGLLYARTAGGSQEIREVAIGGHDTLLRPLAEELANGTMSFAGDSVLVIASRAGIFSVSARTHHVRQLYSPVPGEVGGNWYRFVAGVSRDGRWAAVPVTLKSGNASQAAIRLVPLDGSAGRVVPIGQFSPLSPFIWHPDGQHLLALGNRHHEQRPDVMLVPLNGEPVRPLTAADGSMEFFMPMVSPDGSTIAYAVLTGLSATLWEIDLTRALAPFAAQAPER